MNRNNVNIYAESVDSVGISLVQKGYLDNNKWSELGVLVLVPKLYILYIRGEEVIPQLFFKDRGCCEILKPNCVLW